MTDHNHRNVTPGTGDIVTFMDCPDRWYELEYSMVHPPDQYSCQQWFLDMGTVYLCDTCREAGKCPRGFR